MVAPINSVKHYVLNPDAAVATGTIQVDDVVTAVAVPTAIQDEVKQGSLIKAVYFEIWLSGTQATGIVSQFTVTIEKLIGGQPDMTLAQALNLHNYPNKKNIFYTTQGIVNSAANGTPTTPIFRQFILIPKGKQRFGLGDRLVINIAAVLSLRRCGMQTYKEYT